MAEIESAINPNTVDPSQAAPQHSLACRMYEDRFPEVEAVVMVNVKQIAEIGAYVHLLEYGNIEGMIQLSEFSRRRIRSIQKLVRVGRNEVVVVMRVDKDKGYIDLSKRRASPEDVASCEERYNKSKAVHSIMRHCADRLNMDLEELYSLYAWPLYKKYGHAYDAFKICITDPDTVLLDMPQHIKKELLKHVRQRLTPQPIKIRADIEVTCFGYEGIDAIKKALTEGEGCSTELVPIKIKLVAPPLYVMITNSTDKTNAIATMEKAITVIEECIKLNQGSLAVKMKNDEAELKQLMDKLANENTEVAGDSDEESSDDE